MMMREEVGIIGDLDDERKDLYKWLKIILNQSFIKRYPTFNSSFNDYVR